jgi:hypothetical protein
MNKSHHKTIQQITRLPISATIEWRKIESLLQALGAKVVEGAGSRVRFELRGIVGTFHRPHPQKEAKPYQVRDVLKFSEMAGVIEYEHDEL